MLNNKSVFIPPLEAETLFLKLTTGCSYNQCSFCGTYRETVFRMREFDQLSAEVGKAKKKYQDDVFNVLLGEGDALVAPSPMIKKTLRLIKDSFPNLQNVGVYATASALLKKTDKELKALNRSGLRSIYLGLESGSNKILRVMNKGVKADEIKEACIKAIEAGFKLNTHVMLGAGGRADFRTHATRTGELLTRIKPDVIIMLTLILVPHTPLFEKARRSGFTPPTPVESVLELKLLIENLDLNHTIFKSKHSSNYLKVSGVLPKDKQEMLHKLERVLNNPTEEFFNPEYFRGA